MKKVIHLVIVLTLHFTTSFAQTCYPQGHACPPVGDPYFTGHCHGVMDRYLSRAMSMDFLIDALQPLEPADPCNNELYACSQVEPYTTCYARCTTRYCQNIQLAVNMQATFLRRVAGVWGHEWKLQNHEWYNNAMIQAVQDINLAYDCAGLRRPIIQAAILEIVTNNVGALQIPTSIIMNFSSDADFPSSRFAANPSGTYFFDVNEIKHMGPVPGASWDVPDLNRIEARMWVFFLASKYLDAGYRALHMGQLPNMMALNDPGFHKTFDLFQKIRNHASSKPNCPFVLIDAHTDHDLYVGSSNQLILDFNSYPIRPIESTNPNCSMWTFPSMGHPGIYSSNGGQQPGPIACYYDATPLMLEFDHHSGICGTPGVSCGGCEWCPWGYDESSWFHKLSPQCKADWVSQYACLVRERSANKRVYMQMPGLQGLGNMTNQPPGGTWVNGKYQLADNPVLQNAILNNVWNVNPNFNITVEEMCLNPQLPCSPFEIQGKKRYRMKLNNPDCSSIYTWHIQNVTTQQWENFTYGSERIFEPAVGGWYTIYLRRDNLGSSPEVKQAGFNLLLNTNCCELPIFPNWGTWQPFFSGSFKPGRTESELADIITVNEAGVAVNAARVNEKTPVVLEKEISQATLTTMVDGIQVYPNPAKSEVHIRFSLNESKVLSIVVLDIYGRKVKATQLLKEAGNHEVTLDIANIPPGIYTVVYKDNGREIRNKLTIVK